jgi:hypothetical protein
MRSLRPCVAAAAILVALAHPHVVGAQRTPQRLVLVRDAVFGASEGEAALSSVSDVTVGRDGRVYVADPQAHAVRVFSADGRRVSTLGREGRGPGELQSPASMGWRGDTLVVSDPFAYRLVGFLPGGRSVFTRTYTVDRFLPRTILPDGRTLGMRMLLSKAIAEGRQTHMEFLSVESTAGPARVVARLPLRHHTARVRVGSGANASEAFFSQPFGDADMGGVDPRGRWTVGVSRPAAASARGSFSLTWRSPAGAVLRTATVPYAATPLPRGAVRDSVEAYVETFSGAFPGIPRSRLAAMIREAVFVPRNHPPVDAVVTGLDGTTWVRRAPVGAAATWMVFDDRGRHVAYVTAPAGAAVRAADRGFAWAVEKDADDVPFVVRYRVQPARR